MRLTRKEIGQLLKGAGKEWMAKDPFRESAILAYYAIFSLPGLLVVVIALAGYFFGKDTVSHHLAKEITATLGAETANEIEHMIVRTSELKNTLWATLMGVGIIIFGATGLFTQFQKSLNMIWKVKTDDSSFNLWKLVRVRLFSFGLILTVAFILIVSLVVSAALSAFGNWISVSLPHSMLILLRIFNFIFSLMIISFLFAMMFKWLPDAKVKWNHVWIGALVTGFLFEVGKFGLGLYFGTANPGSGYGAAGSIVLILLWVSYSSMIVFYGAEFTRLYAEMKDGQIQAKENATAVEYLEITRKPH